LILDRAHAARFPSTDDFVRLRECVIGLDSDQGKNMNSQNESGDIFLIKMLLIDFGNLLLPYR